MGSTKALRLSFALTLAAPAAAFAGDLDVPREYATIDAALDAAKAGDRIVVTGGRHGPLAVTKSDVDLVGYGAVVVSGGTISGNRVGVRGFSFVSKAHDECGDLAGGELVVEGDDVTVADSRFRYIALDGQGARMRAERNVTRNSSITGAAGAVLLDNRIVGSATLSVGEGGRIEGNRSRFRDGVSVYVDAPGVVVRGNHVTLVHAVTAAGLLVEDNVSAEGILAWGPDVTVRANTTMLAGIQVTGDGALVTGNWIGRGESGIYVEGDRPTVTLNHVSAPIGLPNVRGVPRSDVPPAVMVVGAASGATVSGNRVRHARGAGIVVSSSGATVADNTVRGASPATSIDVTGHFNVLSDNDVVRSGSNRNGAGIEVSGGGNRIEDNRVSGAIADGIIVGGGAGNSVAGDDVTSIAGTGIVVDFGATATVITDCDVSGCRLGLIANGDATTVTETTLLSNRLADLLDLTGVEFGAGNRIGVVSDNLRLLPKR